MESVVIPVGPKRLGGFLTLPPNASGLVIFAHGSGSSRFSERNRQVADDLAGAGVGTLLFDLLTEEESREPDYVFGIPLLAERLGWATDWARSHPPCAGLPVGYFGASTGAAAALLAAAALGSPVRAVVSRGGRPDLAGDALIAVRAPTLLIVGGADLEVLELNRRAFDLLTCPKALEIVPRATHLFPERGALERVSAVATAWFLRHLPLNHRAATGARAGAAP